MTLALTRRQASLLLFFLVATNLQLELLKYKVFSITGVGAADVMVLVKVGDYHKMRRMGCRAFQKFLYIRQV